MRLVLVPASISSNSVGFRGVVETDLPLPFPLDVELDASGSAEGDRSRFRGRNGGIVMHVTGTGLTGAEGSILTWRYAV